MNSVFSPFNLIFAGCLSAADYPTTMTSLPAVDITSNSTPEIHPPSRQFMHMELETNSDSTVVPINGYLTPIVVVVTLAANCVVCAVLLRPHMRSPTNALLVAIATSDMLTGLWSVPAFAYFYTGSAGRYREWVPYAWCRAYPILTEFLPTVFHTASIWLTVALAVQR